MPHKEEFERIIIRHLKRIECRQEFIVEALCTLLSRGNQGSPVKLEELTKKLNEAAESLEDSVEQND